MKAMTKDTQAVLEKLHHHTASDVARAEMLHSLADSASMAAVPFMLPFTVNENDRLARTAREAIHKMLLRHRKQDLVSLDQYIRSLDSYHYSNKLAAWHKLTPESIRAFSIQDEADACFVGLCSFHRNGYVRQAAVERLASESAGGELAFLLLRLNDWQPKIRFLAYKALKQKRIVAYAPHFLSNISLVDHLVRYYHREKFTDLVDDIYAMLRHPAQRSVLAGGFCSNDLTVRRLSFELAVGLGAGDQEDIWREAMAQSDALIRLRTSALLVKNESNDCLKNGLERMLVDVFPPIRQLAVQTYVGRYPEKSREVLFAALLDPHKTIRELARYHLKGQHVDFAAFYRTKCAADDERQLAAAIAGLGETGEQADAKRLLPFLDQERTQIRRAAMKAIALLDPEPYSDCFFRLLQSAKRGESREASNVLAGMVDLRHVERLWAIFTTAAEVHVKKHILHIVEKLGKTESIMFMLRACTAPEEAVQQEAVRRIALWLDGCNKKFYVIWNAAQKQQLEALWLQARACLPETLADELLFLVRR